MSIKRLACAGLSLLALIATTPPGRAARVEITGQCVCKKGKSVLATYSSMSCQPNTHAGCTAAKQACVGENQPACGNLGGILSQSSNRCSYGAKC